MVTQSRPMSFSPGPASLPQAVLDDLRDTFSDAKRQQLTPLEISHRSDEFTALRDSCEQRVRELLHVSDEFHVLFLAGGASLQFAMIPMNFLFNQAGYVLTGAWSEKAWNDAKRVGNTTVCYSSKDLNFSKTPDRTLNVDTALDYVHMTSNNTIFGTQIQSFPEVDRARLIVDMSSDLFTRSLDVSAFGCIYACAQKNFGCAGLTLVLLHKDLAARARSELSPILSYTTHIEKNSTYNTPPVFAIYVMNSYLKWMQDIGGIDKLQRAATTRADLVYRALEKHNCYRLHAERLSRSTCNVVFTLASDDLHQKFLSESEKRGFTSLTGHRSVGGFRASLYNGVPLEHVEALAAFIESFGEQHGL